MITVRDLADGSPVAGERIRIFLAQAGGEGSVNGVFESDWHDGRGPAGAILRHTCRRMAPQSQ